MTKLEAARELIYEGYRERRTKKGLRTVRRACEALGLTVEEIITIESVCEYHDNYGALYPTFESVKR